MMIAASLLFAFGVLFIAGAGLVLLLERGRFQLNAFEFAALAWFFGTGSVSLGLWLGGLLFLRGGALQTAVALCALGALVVGLRTTSRNRFPRWPQSVQPLHWLLGAVLVAEILLLGAASYKHTLGWDGLLNWELKARYAFLNHGALPTEYFASAGRAFTHPDYPLAVPFTELWIYLSLGRADQFWAKSIFIIYYASGATLLTALTARVTARRWLGLLTAALLFVTPQISTGIGGAVTGYADFSLSVLYLAAIVFLVMSNWNSEVAPAAFRLYAACLTLIPWFKREGVVLWMIAVVAGLYVIWQQRKPQRALAFLPGVLLLCGWKIFLIARHAAPLHEFAVFSPQTIAALPVRLSAISRALAIEFTNLEQWSLFWPLLGLACCSWLFHFLTDTARILVWSIVIPVALYSATYLFSTWASVDDHIATSLPRLLMHVAPLGWLAIAGAVELALRERFEAAPRPLGACQPRAAAPNRVVDDDSSRDAIA